MQRDKTRLYSATELADEFGTTPRALRFYETKHLLSPRRAGTRRIYDYRDHVRLGLILRGKRLGFTLADIREYLELYEIDTSQISQLKRLGEKVSQRIGDLKHQREALERSLAELVEIQIQVKAALETHRQNNGDREMDLLALSTNLSD